jgi:hypothetical protein
MEQMATAIASSGLFGMKDKNSVLALMAVAQAEGLHPATAARDFHIIQGRPALKADAMLARFQNAGGKVTWKDYTDERVTGVFSHPNGVSLRLHGLSSKQTKSVLSNLGLDGKSSQERCLEAVVFQRGLDQFSLDLLRASTHQKKLKLSPRPSKLRY